MSKTKKQYGLWESPISTHTLTRSTITLSQVRLDGHDTYWVEQHPEQQGRNILFRRSATGQISDFLPLHPEDGLMDIRTAIHEYGGKAYSVSEGIIVMSHSRTGRVFKYDLHNVVQGLVPLTPICDLRFGDFELDLQRNVVYAVCENHEDEENVQNYLVSIPLDGAAARDKEKIKVVFSGTDFVNAPTISPDGKHIAWVSWNHPFMPWEYSVLNIANLDNNSNFKNHTKLIDIENVAVSQPRWSAQNELIHVNDASGFGNFYRTEGFGNGFENLRTRHLCPSEKVFTLPAWELGLHTYDIYDENHLIVTWYKDGISHLGTMRIDNGELEEWNIPYMPYGNVVCHDGRVIVLVNSVTSAPKIVQIYHQDIKVLRSSNTEEIDSAYISVPEHISWETSDGDQSYGFLYLPTSKDFEGVDGQKPPLIVQVHGGPTSQANSGLKIATQYWTSRGYAILDVNYRGSTGYGRTYTEKLKGKWGLYDLDDCISGVKYLIDKAIVDPTRIAIHGGSAGGYTTLAALAFSDIFTAGTSYFGVSDLRLLVEHTHKFESHYLYNLIGSFDLSDSVWKERSPIFHIDKIKSPLLLLQGDIDKVVPVEQAELMYNKMKENGQEVQLKIYEGEGHGFIKDSTNADSFERELDFYTKAWNMK